MHREKSLKQIDKMDHAERQKLAIRKLDSMLDRMTGHIVLHENNQKIWPLLSKQIPRSYSAHAFNSFHRSMSAFEIISLYSFWESLDLDKDTIPTVVALVEKRETIEFVSCDFATKVVRWDPKNDRSKENNVKSDKTNSPFQDLNEIRWNEYREESVRSLSDSIQKSQNILTSSELEQLENDRHKIAHSLKITSKEISSGAKIKPVENDYLQQLLDETIDVIERLRQRVACSSYSWDSWREFSSKNAQSLWEVCRFQIER